MVINFCFAPSSQFLQSEWERTRLMNKEFVLFMHIVPITTVPSGKMLIDAQYIKQSEISCYYPLYFDIYRMFNAPYVSKSSKTIEI